MSIEVVEKCLKKRCNETGVFCKKCNLEGVLCSDGDILCPKCFKKLGKGEARIPFTWQEKLIRNVTITLLIAVACGLFYLGKYII